MERILSTKERISIIEATILDLWVKIKNANEAQLASLTSQIMRKIDKVNILMQKNDTLFYHSLVFGSIVVYGRADGIQL